MVADSNVHFGVAAVLIASVPLRTEATVASVLRWWPELIISLGALTAVTVGIVRSRRRTVRSVPVDDPQVDRAAVS